MKAIIWTKYGSSDYLKLQEVEKPQPNEDEILIKILASTVTAGDCELRRLELPLMLSFPVRLYAGLFKPKRIPVLGQELAGTVEKVGKNVTSYHVGDQVYGTTGFGFGAYAEYICLPADPGDAEGVLSFRPSNLSAEEAAAVPTAGLEALHYLRKGKAKSGKKVLIIGGGGSIGTFAIQLAKYFGAEVTSVDSTGKLGLMRSLGADHVVDYTKEDHTRTDKSYDLIIDVVGRKDLSRRLNLLKPGGSYFLAYARFSDIFYSLWLSMTSKKKLIIESSGQTKEELIYLTDLIEKGKLKSIIDRSFPLDQTAEAHNFAESGVKKGNVILSVQHSAEIL